MSTSLAGSSLGERLSTDRLEPNCTDEAVPILMNDPGIVYRTGQTVQVKAPNGRVITASVCRCDCTKREMIISYGPFQAFVRYDQEGKIIDQHGWKLSALTQHEIGILMEHMAANMFSLNGRPSGQIH